MLLIHAAIDQNVIEEDEHEMAKDWHQCRVHGVLEGCGSTCQAERHDLEFVMAVMHLKRCLVLLSRGKTI